MTSSVAGLATTSAEIRERAGAARRNMGEGIILVPVDFSEHSEAALFEASRYAQAMNASLVVLHVVHDPGEMPGYYSKLIKKKRARQSREHIEPADLSVTQTKNRLPFGDGCGYEIRLPKTRKVS